MVSKAIELAKKLKALAEQGVGGEKTNAAYQLSKLMKKHNISESDIENDTIISKKYKVGPHSELMQQVVVSINDSVSIFTMHRSKVNLVIDATIAEHIEIEAKFNVYRTAYEKQLAENIDIFYRAFVQKNALYSSKKYEPKNYTPEELAKMRKVLNLSKNLDDVNYLKQLNK